MSSVFVPHGYWKSDDLVVNECIECKPSFHSLIASGFASESFSSVFVLVKQCVKYCGLIEDKVMFIGI